MLGKTYFLQHNSRGNVESDTNSLYLPSFNALACVRMAAARRLREESHLQGEEAQDWTGWRRPMVPPDAKRNDLEPRGKDQVGFMCKSIRTAFPDEAKHCGIYEWRAKGTLDKQPNYIVYVGSTCRDKPGALRLRILEYCTDGSHKEDLINEALGRGYELWVRVKTSGGKAPRKNAEDMENKLLDEYDYVWNKRKNGKIRKILPRA